MQNNQILNMWQKNVIDCDFCKKLIIEINERV